MTRRHRTLARLLLTTALALSLTGCVGWNWPERETHATTPLVQFLYGKEELPPQDASVQLRLPIRVGLSFLPSRDTRSGALPTAALRSQVLHQIREKFRGLPYVTEIVIVPDYYLDVRRGKGLEQMQQLARMHRLDLYALASYDILSSDHLTAGSLAYLTIVGQFFVPGDRLQTQTLIDLAVIEPQSKLLVLRAGGTSDVKGLTSMADLDETRYRQLEKGFQLAAEQLLANFATELGDFETRVRAGTAPVQVARKSGATGSGGGGSFDFVLLALLAAGALATGIRAWRRN
jgi:rhombotail lipoprotein